MQPKALKHLHLHRRRSVHRGVQSISSMLATIISGRVGSWLLTLAGRLIISCMDGCMACALCACCLFDTVVQSCSTVLHRVQEVVVVSWCVSGCVAGACFVRGDLDICIHAQGEVHTALVCAGLLWTMQWQGNVHSAGDCNNGAQRQCRRDLHDRLRRFRTLTAPAILHRGTGRTGELHSILHMCC